MKKAFLFIFSFLILAACSKSNSRYYNPYLPSQPVIFSLFIHDTDNVKYPNGVYVNLNYGIAGIAIINKGGDVFQAYDLVCPNHEIQMPCSAMRQKKINDIFVYCKCTHQHNGQEAQFSLITGQSLTPGINYQLKPYPVTKKGDYLIINY